MLCLSVVKCNLGKVNFEPMWSAVTVLSIHDLWGSPQGPSGCIAFTLPFVPTCVDNLDS